MISHLSNFELNEKIKNLAAEERKLTRTIVEHIAEVDKRKLFLGLGHDSLFSYLTKEIGYSEGAAQRRIDAARLLQKIPEVSEKISQGRINLGQITKMQRLLRQTQKGSGRKLDISAQKLILQKLENKNAIQTDLTLAREFGLKINYETRRLIQRDKSVRLELTFSKEEMEWIERARQIFSHKTGGGLKETLIEMAKRAVQGRNPKAPKNSKIGVRPEHSLFTATMAAPQDTMPLPLKAPPLKGVTPRLRRVVLSRHQACQFRDEKTGKICGSKYFLEVDHIHPQWAGGDHSPNNLRALCKNHNLYRYHEGL